MKREAEVNFVEVKFDEVKWSAKEVRPQKNVKIIVENFLKSEKDCVMLIDVYNEWQNGNNLRRSLQSCIERNNFNCFVFMSHNQVFLKRKEI